LQVDGTPVNMVSHAHGQGYSDLHFLIPEIVKRVTVRKGPYAAEDGDFATGASLSFETADRLERSLSVRGGSFETGQVLATIPFGGDASAPGGYVAVAGLSTRGPFELPQDHRRGQLFVKATSPLGDARVIGTFSGYSASWNASGQVPERAVRLGAVQRFGAIDDTEGGETSRFEGALAIEGVRDDASWFARAFLMRYDFDLFSNFTFFLNDPVNGDGIEQVDHRTIAGLSAKGSRNGRWLGTRGRLNAGIGLRSDRADVELHHQLKRDRLAPGVNVRIAQDHVFGYVEREMDAGKRIRLRLGLRADGMRFAVSDRLEPSRDHVWKALVSPKASLAIDVTSSMTLFVNSGTGFHSNDARAVVQAGDSLRALPRAAAGEFGARHTSGWGSVSLALWQLDLQSELTYVGDEGTTESGGRTRRRGVDASMRVAFTPWLWTDVDLNLARGRFRDARKGEDHVPLAPTITTAGGLSADRDRWRASIRWRSIGSRPADPSGSIQARGSTLWEIFGTWRAGRAAINLTIDNLFDVDWNEAQFATTSRLSHETESVTELHFTPGAPRSVQLALIWSF
jgi:hypothetical protein